MLLELKTAELGKAKTRKLGEARIVGEAKHHYHAPDIVISSSSDTKVKQQGKIPNMVILPCCFILVSDGLEIAISGA